MDKNQRKIRRVCMNGDRTGREWGGGQLYLQERPQTGERAEMGKRGHGREWSRAEWHFYSLLLKDHFHILYT
jgi:hypothetical protein